MLAAVPNTEWTSTSVARVYSDPFGGIRGNTDADVPGDHRFLGATRDADSGLTLLGARYYDPVTGCFISVDPILNLEVPAHLHAYAYGFNNPVTFSDASGLEPRDQNGNFDGDPYSSPSTTSWAYLNGCGGNLSCVGTWVGQNTLHYYGGLAEGLVGLAFFACSSICMVGASVHSAVGAFSDWDAHLANEQAKGEQFREWWSDPWNNFWRPIGEDWANNPGHAWGGTVFTAATIAVPGGGLIKLGSSTRAASAVNAGSARFVVNSAGDALDTARVVIPEGKFTYLLDRSEKSGIFSDSLGFSRDTLEPALISHLTTHFGSATPSVPILGGGTKFTVSGSMTGPSGQTWDIRTAWAVDPDGTTRLITATK